MNKALSIVDQERLRIADELLQMTRTAGWLRFKNEIEARMLQSSEKLDYMMDMQPEKITTKMAYRLSASRRVLRDLLHWVDEQMALGDSVIKEIQSSADTAGR